MTTKLDTNTSFLMGWNYGSTDQARELTAREIGQNWPDVDESIFANGMLDGLAKDRFRLDLSLRNDPRSWALRAA